MDALLELEDLSKSFPGQTAVDAVSLSIRPGEFFSLLGPSGCGKTTTLRLIAGFETPTQGDIRLRGKSIVSLPPYHRAVSTVFQNYALFPHMTARQNIEFGLRHNNVLEPAPRVRKLLDLVQLAGKENRKPDQLSGGEKQRVALARSLAVEPDLLLLDEPLSALDPNLRKQMRAELKSLQRSTGVTFLFITHDQEEALSLSDRLAVMNSGHLEQFGTPEELYLRPATRFVAGFLGAMNWFNGIGLRPEATRLSSTPPNNGCHAFPAVVRSSTFLGNCFHIESELTNGETVVSEVPRLENGFHTGDRVHVWWNPQDELKLPS